MVKQHVNSTLTITLPNGTIYHLDSALEEER